MDALGRIWGQKRRSRGRREEKRDIDETKNDGANFGNLGLFTIFFSPACLLRTTMFVSELVYILIIFPMARRECKRT